MSDEMRLYELPDNPLPQGGRALALAAKDGALLRAALWSRPDSRGTVAVFTGRAEFIERYFEVIGELLSRGFDVVALDWRGQGLSQRQLRDRHKGHIDDFDIYQTDIEALVAHVLAPLCPKPWFALAHSMGGAILLSHARKGASPFERLVAVAPMVSLAGVPIQRTAALGAEVLDIIGFGGAYIPGGGPTPIFFRPFSETALTSDKVRYARTAAIVKAAPDLGIGDPTIGWTNAAFRQMRQFADPDFPRRTFTPLLIIAAGADRVVSTPDVEIFASRLKAGRFITLPHARHEILMERDVFRAQFWAAFDSFVPGVEDRVAQSVAAALKAPKRKRSFWKSLLPGQKAATTPAKP